MCIKNLKSFQFAPKCWLPSWVISLFLLCCGSSAWSQTLDGAGADGENGGDGQTIIIDAADYNATDDFFFSFVNLAGGNGEAAGGPGTDGGTGGNGGELFIFDLFGDPISQTRFEATFIDLSGGAAGNGDALTNLEDADGGRGGDGGDIFLSGSFSQGFLFLNGGDGGDGDATGEGGNGGNAGLIRTEGYLVGRGSGTTADISLVGGRGGLGTINSSAHGISGDSGTVRVRTGTEWISSVATGIFNVDLSSAPTGAASGMNVGSGDAGTFEMNGGSVDWQAGTIDISNGTGDGGGVFDMTGGEFTLSGGNINMQHYPTSGWPYWTLSGGTFNFSGGSINLGGLNIIGGSPPPGPGGWLSLSGGTLVTSEAKYGSFSGRFDYHFGTLRLTDSEIHYGAGLDGWIDAVEASEGISGNRTLQIDGNFIKYDSEKFGISGNAHLEIGGDLDLTGGLFNVAGGKLTAGRIISIPVVNADPLDFRYTAGDITLTDGTTDFRSLVPGTFDSPEDGNFEVQIGAVFHADAIDGVGNILINSGAEISAEGNTALGFASGKTNYLNISGTDSLLHAGNNIYIGRSNGATTVANITNDGNLSVSELTTIGFNGGSSGTANVDDGRLTTSRLIVSDIGPGRLNVRNGGVVDVWSDANLGWWTNSNGAVEVTGEGSELNVQGPFSIGNRGYGELMVDAGADVTNQNTTTVGVVAGSEGNLYVDGNGSTFTTNSLFVGEAATGLVQVDNRARLDAQGDVKVGSGGQGVLTVNNNGLIDIDGDLTIADQAGSSGTVNIHSGGSLYVQNLLWGAGAGTLNFTNGTLGFRGNRVLDNTFMTAQGIHNLTSGQTVQLLGAVSISSNLDYAAQGNLEFTNFSISNGEFDVDGNVRSLGTTLLKDNSELNIIGGRFTSEGSMTVGGASGLPGVVNVNGGELQARNGLFIGPNAGEDGILNVSGGFVNGEDMTVGPSGVLNQTVGGVELYRFNGLGLEGGTMTVSGGEVRLMGGNLVMKGVEVFEPADGGHLIIDSGLVELDGGAIDLSGSDSPTSNGNAGLAGELRLNGGTLRLVDGSIDLRSGLPGFGIPIPAAGKLTIEGGTLDVHPDTVAGIVTGDLDFMSGTIHTRSQYGVGFTTGAIADLLGNANLSLGTSQRLSTEGRFFVTNEGAGGATLENGAVIDVGTDAFIGFGSTSVASLTIEAGSRMETTGKAVVGFNSGATATATIRNSSSSLTVGTDLIVSDIGEGRLILESGGNAISANNTEIGWWFGSDGEVNLTGTGTNLSMTGSLTIGNRGEGTLSIGNGSNVYSPGGTTVASNAASTGTLILDGGTLNTSGLTAGDGSASLDLRSGEIRLSGQQTIDAEMVDLLGMDAPTPGGVALTFLDNAALTGADVRLAGGQLNLTGHNLQVTNGASLGTSGVINGSVTIGNGTLIPGNSPGTLTVDDLILSSDSTLDFELANPDLVGLGVNDLIAINGDLTLDGTINVVALNGFTGGDYTLMTSSTLNSFTNNGLEVGNLPAGYSSSVSYDSGTGSVILSVVPDDPTRDFPNWIATFGLPQEERLPGSDFDQDGRNNLVEFATGGNPTSGTDEPRTSGMMVDDGGTEYPTWTIPMLDEATFSGNPLAATINGITYQIYCKSGPTMSASALTLVERAPVTDGLPSLPPGYEYRSFRLTTTSEEHAFLWLGISQGE